MCIKCRRVTVFGAFRRSHLKTMEGIDYQVLIVAPQTEPDKNRARIFVIEKVRREKDSRSGGPSAALVQVKLGVFVFQAILGGARRVFAYLHASMQTVFV